MASASAHFIVGAALALPALQSRRLTALLPALLPVWTLPLSAGLLAMIPDLDLAGRRLFGIRNLSPLSHRGIFHSPFFLIVLTAILAGTLALAFARDSPRKSFVYLWLLWAGCILTHPLLDALTDGGRGVMLLVPFARTRLHFIWRPIPTPPRNVHLLARAFLISWSELPFCVAAVLIGMSGLLLRRRQNASGGNRRERFTIPEEPL